MQHLVAHKQPGHNWEPEGGGPSANNGGPKHFHSQPALICAMLLTLSTHTDNSRLPPAPTFRVSKGFTAGRTQGGERAAERVAGAEHAVGQAPAGQLAQHLAVHRRGC